MTPEQFQAVERLFFEASGLPPAEREAFVRAATTDGAVRREVLGMLAMDSAQAARSTHIQVGLERLAQDAEAVAAEAWVGRSIGSYRIDAFLASGGMGVVFRGHDEKLDRTVAIKVLPDTLSRDTERLKRFEREARLIASVTHPNIASVFGLEEADGRKFLVMELLRGPTLAHRLRRGPLPMDRAIEIGGQVAAALQSAHDAGVIHRDLKPSNVMYVDERSVKVLDFGLAQSVGGASGQSGLTHTGVAIGTPGYMSPEQARGLSVDKRTDVFAFGCLLFECLTGQAAFSGNSHADMIAGVLHRDPDWSLLPERTPAMVRRLLQRCMAKDPINRIRDMGDIRLELEDAGKASTVEPVPTSGPARPAHAKPPRAIPTWGVAAAAVIALAVGVMTGNRFMPRAPASLPPDKPAADPAATTAGRVTRFTVDFPKSIPQKYLGRLSLAVSRDGRHLVYVAADASGQMSLWRRDLDSFGLTRLPQTENASMPFFSPRSDWIGYSANGVLWRQWRDGSNPMLLSDIHGFWGAHWSADDRIAYVYIWGQPLALMSANGGRPERLGKVRSESQETAHVSPHITPGGKAVLYTVWMGGQPIPRIDAIDLATGQQKTIVGQGAAPRVAMTPHGPYLLWVRRNTLMAAPFDEASLTIGEEKAIVNEVLTDAPNALACYDVSDEGTLVFVPGPYFSDQTRLAWADLKAGTGSEPLTGDPMACADPRFSTDGRRISVVLRRNSYQSALLDLDTGVVQRVSTEDDVSSGSISPDGKWFAYGSNRTGRYGLYLRDLTRGEERQIGSETYDYPGFVQWSPDGKRLAFCAASGDLGSRDIFIIELGDNEIPQPFSPSHFHETDCVFSPNGQWLAYSSAFSATESSVREVYIATITDGGKRRFLISRGGGHSPQWAPDGKLIYYRSGNAIMAVDIDPQSGEPVSPPRVVWQGQFGQPDPDLTNYAVAPDGRILIVEQSDEGYKAEHIHVVMNWHLLLDQR